MNMWRNAERSVIKVSKKYDGLSRIIIQNVGGKGNIDALEHCFTRLRFRLKDESLAQTDVIKGTDGVIDVVQAGGQYQVVIGTHVSDVYESVMRIAKLDVANDAQEGQKKKGLDGVLDTFAGIFGPLIGLLCACGVLKGFLTLATTIGIMSSDSGTYQVLYAIADVIFNFFPVMLGYTTARKFGSSPVIGMAIGAAMIYPTLVELSSADPIMTLFEGTIFESSVPITFLGIPVMLNDYTSTVIPAILATWLGGKIEIRLKKVIPSVIASFTVPLVTLVVTVPLALLVIGPISEWISDLLTTGFFALYSASPILYGLLLGGLWQIMVIFGVHHGFLPIVINNLATIGYDTVFAATLAGSFTQMAVLIAIIIKARGARLRGTAITALFSATFGITEPAIYGVTLPLKKPFIISCIAAGIGGAIALGGGTRYFTMGGQGIFAFLCYMDPSGNQMSLIASVIGIGVAMVLSFLGTMFFWNEPEADAEQEEA